MGTTILIVSGLLGGAVPVALLAQGVDDQGTGTIPLWVAAGIGSVLIGAIGVLWRENSSLNKERREEIRLQTTSSAAQADAQRLHAEAAREGQALSKDLVEKMSGWFQTQERILTQLEALRDEARDARRRS